MTNDILREVIEGSSLVGKEPQSKVNHGMLPCKHVLESQAVGILIQVVKTRGEKRSPSVIIGYEGRK